MARITASQRNKIFGAACTPRNLVTVNTPWGLRARAHSLVAERFLYACELAAETSGWVPLRIDSYACRQVRGSTATSLHSYALAWDFFNRKYPDGVDVWGPANAPPAPFRAAFKQAGFALGAEFTSRKDYPHIEWADGLPPPAALSARPGVIVAVADIDVPLVKPITYTRIGEAAGMKVSTHYIDIPALDRDGRGWVDIPYPLERVFDITGQGSSPPDDGYWQPVLATVQPRGELTRVTLAGAPSQHTGVFWKLLESED